MAYNEQSLVQLSGLKALAERTKTELQSVSNVAAEAIKYVSVSGNTVRFFKTADGTVDISGKADKVSEATEGHLTAIDANRNLTDSGSAIASGTEVTEMLNDVC